MSSFLNQLALRVEIQAFSISSGEVRQRSTMSDMLSLVLMECSFSEAIRSAGSLNWTGADGPLNWFAVSTCFRRRDGAGADSTPLSLSVVSSSDGWTRSSGTTVRERKSERSEATCERLIGSSMTSSLYDHAGN